MILNHFHSRHSSVFTFALRTMAEFIRALGPKDHLSMAMFDLETEKLFDWRNAEDGIPTDVSILPSVPAILPAKPKLDVKGAGAFGHDFYGALTWASTELGRIPGRKAVVVFGDGRDTRLDPVLLNNESAQQVLDPLFGLPDMAEEAAFQDVALLVKRSGARFYFVAYGTDRNPLVPEDYGLPRYITSRYKNPDLAQKYLVRVRSRMERLAEISGGRVIFPAKPEEVVPLTQRIAHDLSTSYRLSYVPAKPQKDGSYRRVEVRVSNPSLRTVQSREGYYSR